LLRVILVIMNYIVNLSNSCIDGPHKIEEFEASKRATEYQFSFET